MSLEISSTPLTSKGAGFADFKPHLRLPYNVRLLDGEVLTATISYSTATFTWVVGDGEWPENTDFFPVWLIIELQVDNVNYWMSHHYEGIAVELYPETNQFIIQQDISAMQKLPVLWQKTPQRNWKWVHRWHLFGTKAGVTQTLTLKVLNATEESIDKIYAWIYGYTLGAT